MRILQNLSIGLLLMLVNMTSAFAGIGYKDDLKAPLFAGEPDLEDCLDDMARLTPATSTGPMGKRLVSRGPAVTLVKLALNTLTFVGPYRYDLGPRGDPSHAEFDAYDQATWEAIKAFKFNYKLGSYEWGDVGPGTMKKLDELMIAIQKTVPGPPPSVECPRRNRKFYDQSHYKTRAYQKAFGVANNFPLMGSTTWF